MTGRPFDLPQIPPIVGIKQDLKLLSLRQLVEMQHYTDKLIEEKTVKVEKPIYIWPRPE